MRKYVCEVTPPYRERRPEQFIPSDVEQTCAIVDIVLCVEVFGFIRDLQ